MGNCFVSSIKRLIKKIIIFAVIALIIILSVKLYNYLHVGYSIKNMNVKVDVSENKEYKVTEVIDAHFYVSKKGINRFISNNVTKGSFTISDISVDGEKYDAVTDKYGGVSIKTGDENRKVSGDKKYVIHYTLSHYDGFNKTDKNFELNLLENDHEAKVENFTGQVNFPKGCKLTDTKSYLYKADSDYKYICSKNNSSINCEVKDNNLFVKDKDLIPVDMGICIKTVLDKKSFSNIPSQAKSEHNDFMSLDHPMKEYVPTNYIEKTVKFIKSYPQVIAFPAIVLIGVLIEISRANSARRARERNLRRKREHPDSLYNICFINNDGEDCCCGDSDYNDRW